MSQFQTLFLAFRNIEVLTYFVTNEKSFKIFSIGLKSGSQFPKKTVLFALKMINVFYFILKALFVLKIFKFLSRLFGHIGKTAWLENSKLMTSQPGSQTIAIHILPNILQSKGNQTMKFGQLIEHNKRNIFSSKIMQKMAQGD